MSTYKKRLGDRKEGRLVRTIPAYNKFVPYIMPVRDDRLNYYEESFEVTELDRRLRKLRVEGYKGIGMLHFLIAAYVRGVARYPAMNRFVVGRRIYARNNIEVVMTVKRALTVDAEETSIKVIFEPTDTVFDVYNKMNAAISEIKTGDTNTSTDNVAETLCKLPRFLLRFALGFIRMMDYFGWLPQALLNASPFHGSMIITDLGSLGIGPIYHHIYNFGTLPVFVAFGAKHHKYELDRHGDMVDRKYIDCKFVMDEGICDGHYFAQFLKAVRYMFLHPEIVEAPPAEVHEDIL